MNFSVKKMAIMAALLALNVVLSKFSIHTWDVKIGFAFVTLVVAANLYGFVEAGIIAALGDVIGWVINPVGAFFPGFTITAVLTAVVFALFLKGKITVVRTLIAVAINQFFIGLVLNTINISILYGKGFIALFPTRIFQSVLLMVVQTVTILAMEKVLLGRLRVLAEDDDSAKGVA